MVGALEPTPNVRRRALISPAMPAGTATNAPRCTTSRGTIRFPDSTGYRTAGDGAHGRTRTDTTREDRGILSPLRLPFRHVGRAPAVASL